MASAEEAVAVAEAAAATSVDGELKQEITNTDSLQENPKDKDEEEAVAKGEGGGKKEEGMEKLKSSLVLSGVAIAVIGAIFALAKKIKDSSRQQ